MQTAADPGPAWPARPRIAAEFEGEARAVSGQVQESVGILPCRTWPANRCGNPSHPSGGRPARFMRGRMRLKVV
ncbi:hypothetical protein J2X87_000986 [Pseudomonas synxantha]|uniref:Uncharacterized protein n=1 Tax=Pseudomonas synxantha TaxID=47883 RepID=A0ACC6JHW5_9PSED|nr:hypothetical protein [Pseudomonas synxantha]